AVEDVMRQYGREVAHGTVVRLYRDVRTIHERIARYDQQEVDAWLDRMQVELDAYTGRMQAMCDAALDAAQLQQTSDRIVASGATIRSQDTLTAADNSLPLAWTVIADRSS
ncbi:MAG: hypothetical protein KJO55_03965, partial [Gammaproteobacteria bacterium]|nr:hypothetical protein [Gammaproteobacteria bacterium]